MSIADAQSPAPIQPLPAPAPTAQAQPAPEAAVAPAPLTAPAPSLAPGRPRALNILKQQQFCDMLRMGCSRSEAARAIGLSVRTIHRHERENPEFAEAIEQAFWASDTRAYRSVVRAGEQSWRAAAWLIEHRSRREQHPRRPSPDSILKSPRFEELLRDMVCEAIVANEISVDPGVLRRKKRLAEMREEIESRKRRGQEAMTLENSAHELAREIAKILRRAMRAP